MPKAIDFSALMKKKGPQERSSLGIDIGTSTVKTVALCFVKDEVILTDFHVESTQLDLEAVVKKIIPPKAPALVNVSVSGSAAAMIRYISFPKMTADELKQALKFEAQKHIPFSINEVYVDSCILKDTLPDNKMLILLAAVKKDFLSQRLKVIEGAGLKAHIVDLDSVALMNAFTYQFGVEQLPVNKAVALLNIGATMTNLNILEAGIPHLSRDMHIGGNNFTQKMADALGVDFKIAEEAKVRADKETIGKTTSVIESLASHLASEVRISFDYYESQHASSLAKIFLSGGGSAFAGLKEMLAGLLGIEVEFWDPLKKIRMGEGVDAGAAATFSGQLAVAAGLALRG